MSETISMPALQNAVESLRRRAPGMSWVDTCKLRALEANLRIVQDQHLSTRVRRLLRRYEIAILYMEANADAAGRIADDMRRSNRIVADDSRAAIQRSRKLLDAYVRR